MELWIALCTAGSLNSPAGQPSRPAWPCWSGSWNKRSGTGSWTAIRPASLADSGPTGGPRTSSTTRAPSPCLTGRRCASWRPRWSPGRPISSAAGVMSLSSPPVPRPGSGRCRASSAPTSTPSYGPGRSGGRQRPHRVALSTRAPRASALEQLGYEHLRRHDLRHTGLTWMADAGVPVHVLRKIAGHGSLVTTQRYLHPDAQSIADAGTALSAHLTANWSPNGPQLRLVKDS